MKRIIICFIVASIVWSHPIIGQSDTTLNPQYLAVIKSLVKNPRIQKAFDIIQAQDAQTLKDHITLTEIPAPPFAEEKRAAYYAQMLKEIGVDSVWIDSIGNVLALRKGTDGKKTIVLDAHSDTVFPENTDVTVYQNGDTLFAPGVGDDTRGMAMILSVLRAMNEAKIQTKEHVLFVASVGEEGLGDLRGVKYLFREGGPKIDTWISIDGGDLGRVNYKGLGSYRYRVIIRGPGGHSWGAFGLANPHHAQANVIRHFVEAADAYTQTGPKTSYNVGRMGGGTSVNSIPFSSWMEVDIRSLQPSRLDDMEKILKAAVAKGVAEQNEIRREGRPLIYEIEMIGKRPSGELSPQLPLIQRAMALCEVFEVAAQHTRGSTNSNIPISLGVPAITIGRGGEGAWAHSLLEWWANKDGYLSIQYALGLLVAEAGIDE